jgi:mRNA interferase YafQ
LAIAERLKLIQHATAGAFPDILDANDAPLGAEWLDHPLGGDWDGHRECHIGGDFLLAYKLVDSAKHGLVVFVRTGTHAELFE